MVKRQPIVSRRLGQIQVVGEHAGEITGKLSGPAPQQEIVKAMVRLGHQYRRLGPVR